MYQWYPSCNNNEKAKKLYKCICKIVILREVYIIKLSEFSPLNITENYKYGNTNQSYLSYQEMKERNFMWYKIFTTNYFLRYLWNPITYNMGNLNIKIIK